MILGGGGSKLGFVIWLQGSVFLRSSFIQDCYTGMHLLDNSGAAV